MTTLQLETMSIDTIALKGTISLPSLLERDKVKLRKSGDHFVCLCPFHREKTPSCHVWEKNFHCFGCGAAGDVIEYIRKTRSLSFLQAVDMLSDGQFSRPNHQPIAARPVTAEPAPDFDRLTLQWFTETTDEKLTNLAIQLGVTAEALWWLSTCWAFQHKAWAFPMFNAKRCVIGIRLRDDRGKKWAVKGSKQGLFIPSISPGARLFVAEGPTDTCACLSLGFHAIGRASCNGGVEQVLEYLRLHRVIREVVLVTDNDEAGIRGADALRKELPLRSYQLLLPPKDIRRFVNLGGGKEMIESMIANQVPQRGKGK